MKKNVTDFELNGKTVVLRSDLNVSIKDGKIIDDTRIKASLETINYLLDNGAKIVLLSHLGKIKKEEDKIKNDMKIVYERLNELLPDKFTFVNETSDISIRESVNNLAFGKGILLQNTRYEDLDGKKESSCNMNLALFWASLGDIFINDAFGTLHRSHASNVGIASYLDSGIGFLIEKELKELDKLNNPKTPFAVIMGGAKISDKLKVIESLLPKVNILLIGGAMANTFIKAMGLAIGDCLYEEEYVDYCRELYQNNKEKIFFSIDMKGTYGFDNDLAIELHDAISIPNKFMGLDIGPKTIELFKKKLENVETLFWNGPVGVYEFSNYQDGTNELLSFITKNIPTTILGGGDIVGAAANLGFIDKVTFASTGGGATLSYLEDNNLPGLVCIKEKEEKPVKKIIALNHKSYMSYEDVKEYINELKDLNLKENNIIIIPSNIYLPYFKDLDSYLGIQNINGEFATGEISGLQAKYLGVEYSIIGHSERKQVLNESNISTNTNLKEVINNNIIPIVCTGETKEQRDNGETKDHILNQLTDYFKDIDITKEIIIAYEPIWAIGTGLIPTNEEIFEVIKLIKDYIFNTYKIKIKVLYGGSVNENNIKELSTISNLDGFLVGKASTLINFVKSI